MKSVSQSLFIPRAAACLALLLVLATSAVADETLAWPRVTSSSRPWAYWWWMGSAVTKSDLTWNLETYQKAGYGGVHIVPIYGAIGYEDQYIDYLSPRWMAMLAHTVSEAQRLDMEVDMTTGTGWCFGGPNISDDLANARVQFKTYQLELGQRIHIDVPARQIQAAVVFGPHRESLDWTDRITPNGDVEWDASVTGWTLFVVSQHPSGRRVKRAAPGGEGWMLNPFSKPAITSYLKRFDQAFRTYTGPMPRAMYHDSYEYICDWSPDLFSEFARRRGYSLKDHLPTFFGTSGSQQQARLKYDYRLTVSDMMLENFIATWVDWCHARGLMTRNQAHGSPANLLDLYGACDVPETEFFRQDRSILFAKVSSSAAHVMGRPLTTCETGTWLNEHFHVTLAELKDLIDNLFVAGVNHVFYHGTCYSPKNAAWPGWLFYASTEMNPRNSIWHDVPALNAFVARCQSILQAGQPANDLLVYWPIHDYWQQPAGMLQNLTVGRSPQWLIKQPFGRLAQQLWERGNTFDYLSDRQLASATSFGGTIRLPCDLAYRAIIVPECRLMPETTLKQLLTLAQNGATILFEKCLPNDVPGLGRLDERRAKLRALIDGLTFENSASGSRVDTHLAEQNDSGACRVAACGKGRVLVGDIETLLARASVLREPMVDAGLEFIRRTHNRGYHYFVTHQGDHAIDGWITLAIHARSAAIMDPMSGQIALAAVRQQNGQSQIYLQLEPKQSLILRTFAYDVVNGPQWPYVRRAGEAVSLHNGASAPVWRITFREGGPVLPAPLETQTLDSWTKIGDTEAVRFAGTARYTCTFDRPPVDGTATSWQLDLGRVEQSARVRVNGRDLGTVIHAPFRVRLDDLNRTGNVLDIDVTNRSANRIRDLDRRGVKWKRFHNINFVSIDYKPFDASNAPIQDSGLIGPVTLTPLHPIDPNAHPHLR